MVIVLIVFKLLYSISLYTYVGKYSKVMMTQQIDSHRKPQSQTVPGKCEWVNLAIVKSS